MHPVIARRLLQWQQYGKSFPWELMICPTYHCNLKCGICARTWQEQNNPVLFEELTDERWLALVEEGARMGAAYLNIGGGGEPTLRCKLVMQLCAKAKEQGMEGHLQTNGTRLSEEDLLTLVQLGWDYVTFSLDGPTAEINDAIRYKNAYTETVKRIRSLVALKRKHGKTLPHVQINMVITAMNYHQLDRMVDFCHENGVEFLSVVPLIAYSKEMTSYILGAQEQEQLPGQVQQAVALADKKGIAHNLESLLPSACEGGNLDTDGDHSKNQQWPSGHLATVRCLEPWRGMVISSSGQVAPCCFFWDEHADRVKETALEEVWFGNYLTQFRRQMLTGVLPEPCKTCGFPDSPSHRELMRCFKHEILVEPESSPFLGKLIFKAFRTLYYYGLRGSVERYFQWRKIQRALAREEKAK